MPPLLLFGYGNPGWGDDALGPALIAAIESKGVPGLECQLDMQLQVEHVTDLQGRERILFVDADASCDPPCVLERIAAQQDESYSSHAMTPQALLYAYRLVYGVAAPDAWLLRIRGYSFALGDAISPNANNHLNQAMVITEQFFINRGEA